MSNRTLALPEALQEYVIANSAPLDELQQGLIAETEALGSIAGMQISPEQGAFMTWLVRLIGARSAVEVGTFTGYSSLAIGRGLVESGHLLCCDINEEWTSIARRYWARAGLTDRIELRLAPALQTLRQLPPDPVIDFSFIDADKINYLNYWNELVPRTRSGGVLVVDNVLWSGRVVDETVNDPNTAAIREFNKYTQNDKRVDLVMLPISDGLTLARKK